MLTVGSVLAVTFLLVEWRLATLPILPLRLFRVRNILIIYTTTLTTGINYYCNLYFLPSYYTDARGFTPVQAGIYLLPLILIQPCRSGLTIKDIKSTCQASGMEAWGRTTRGNLELTATLFILCDLRTHLQAITSTYNTVQQTTSDYCPVLLTSDLIFAPLVFIQEPLRY